MGHQEYDCIRQWLHHYSAWELLHKNYYLEHHNFMPFNYLAEYGDSTDDLEKVREHFKGPDSMLGQPSFGLFNMWSGNEYHHSTTIFEQMTSDVLIDATYDLSCVRHPRYCKAPKHTHDYYELAYVFSGKVHHTVWAGHTRQNITLRDGAFLLIPPTVSHEVYVKDESILINILFRKNTCETALLQNLPEDSALAVFFRGVLYAENPSYLVLQTDNAPDLQECLFDLMIEDYGNGQYRRELANLKASTLFLNLLNRTELSIESYGQDWRKTDYIPAIISYMEAHYATVTPQKVADVFCFNRAHLCRIYKNHTGSTLQNAIASIRIRRAQELLRHSDFSVSVICQMVGYDDVTNFIRRFKAYCNQTPHQYRLGCQRNNLG